MGIRFCAKLLENRKSQSKNLWRKWSWFRSAVRRLPFYFLRSKDAVDILFRKKKTNEVYFATLNLLEFCAGRSSIGGQDGARTRGSIEKLLTRSSKTSYGTKSLVSSGPHFFSVPDSVDDILCSRMSFGTLPTAFILSFPAFHFTPTRYSKSSHDSSIRGYVDEQKWGVNGVYGVNDEIVITSKSVKSIWSLFCNHFCIVKVNVKS